MNDLWIHNLLLKKQTDYDKWVIKVEGLTKG